MKLKEEIYAKDEINTGRQPEMDVAKTMFVLVMALIHSTIACIPENQLEHGIPYLIDTVIGGPMAAPVMMFCMGACMRYSRHHMWQNFLKRGVFLFFGGLLLNVCRYTIPGLIGYSLTGDYQRYLAPLFYKTLCNDILTFAGLAFLVMGLCLKWKTKDWMMLGISLLGTLLGTVFNGMDTGNPFGNVFLGFLIGTEDALGLVEADFPLLNWLIVPVCGYLFGKKLMYVRNKALFYRWISGICIAVCVPYYLIAISMRAGMFGIGQNCYYHVTFTDAIICILTSLGMMGVDFKIAMHLPEKIEAGCRILGKNLTAVYCIHWVILSYVIDIGWPILYDSKEGNMFFVLLISFGITVASVVLAVFFYDSCRKRLVIIKERIYK